MVNFHASTVTQLPGDTATCAVLVALDTSCRYLAALKPPSASALLASLARSTIADAAYAVPPVSAITRATVLVTLAYLSRLRTARSGAAWLAGQLWPSSSRVLLTCLIPSPMRNALPRLQGGADIPLTSR